jgi:hypothetical protein
MFQSVVDGVLGPNEIGLANECRVRICQLGPEATILFISRLLLEAVL